MESRRVSGRPDILPGRRPPRDDARVNRRGKTSFHVGVAVSSRLEPPSPRDRRPRGAAIVIGGAMADSATSAALDETEVGSYFVANYPPFSVWTREAVGAEAVPALGRPA